MMMLLAWRPFLDPMSLASTWWMLLGPLALGISVAYKAVRVPDMKDYAGQVLGMTAQIIIAMVLLWIGSFLFIEYLVPLIAP
ncbi:MAG: hypothetical protein IT437_01620 [Phycisphaerales bacterium]|nr:hypothetical protein [Phycisphaerales bacterium]